MFNRHQLHAPFSLSFLQVDIAFQLFETMFHKHRMMDRYRVKPDLSTCELTLKCCHFRAIPERSLEVLMTMLDHNIDLSDQCIEHILDALYIAQIWDNKIIRRMKTVRTTFLLRNMTFLGSFVGDDDGRFKTYSMTIE